jgi:predicted  nucleic acid-binding Zn-ribbon protein
MINELLNYQETDAKLRKIETTLSSSPARKKAASAKVYIEGVEENVNKLDDKAGIISSEYDAIVAEQKKITEQLAELEKAVESAEDENEIAYLAKKAEELTGVVKTICANISKINEEFQKVVKEYSEIKSATKKAQSQYAESKKEYDELKGSVQAEKDAIVKELEQIKKKVDPVLMEKYAKKRANKIFPIVYEVTSNVCGACRMELSMLELNKLKNGEIIECDQCGRMLYQK